MVSESPGAPARTRTEPRAPESPTEVSPSGWLATLKRTVADAKEDRITLIAAGVALFWFLAVFPLLIAAVGILALVQATPSLIDGINEGIRSTLPGEAASVLTRAVASARGEAGAGGLLAAIIGVALALWSASAGMAAAQIGLNVAYDVPRDRSWLKKRLMGILLTLVALLLGGVATALLVFGQPLGEIIREQLPGGDWFVIAWTVVRWVLTVLTVLTLFAVFYYLGPNREPPNWKWVSPGGLVGALIWLAASLGFSFYVSSFGGSYAETYGSLAGVVVLVLWLYLSALALLFGGELNGELESQRERERG